jgi:UDP-glucose:(heptosyl)LPS alpha-1,3-glucosyltransferase
MASDARLKLAVVRARYNPFGGAERFVALALDALRAEGTEVTLITREWRESGDASENISAPSRLRKVDPFYLGSTWRDWSFAHGVKKILKATGFDLVQSHERIVGVEIYRAGDGVHASWLERRDRRSGLIARLGTTLNLHHRYLINVERRMFGDQRLRAVICNSQLVKDEIVQRFAVPAERLHVIYNGVDLKRFEPEIVSLDRERMRADLGIERNHSILLFVGSGFARKGLSDALTALASVSQVSLIVIGYDKHASRYRDLAQRLGLSERCHFVGAVTDARAWYGLADGLVLPTIYDPFPNVALEALACGVPILVSDGCGAREVVRQGENGYVTAVGDVAGLAKTIETWRSQITNPTRGDQMRRAARLSALPFDVAHMSRQLLALYRSLLESRAR